MKKIIIFLVLNILFLSLYSQKYFTRTGNVRFFSSTLVEDIEATTNQASCILDTETGEVVAKVLIKSFEFEKALMQEHFNENYMESDKYPKAVLTTKIENLSDVDFTKDGKYKVQLNGAMDMHGVKQDRIIDGEIEIAGDKLIASAKFIVKPNDHDIKIPKMAAASIAEEIEVTVKFDLTVLND